MKQFVNANLRGVFQLLIIAVIFTPGCQQQKPDPSVEMKPLVDKYVEVWNTGNVDELDAVMAEDFVRHAEASSAEGIDSVKQLIINTRTAFPDLHLTLDNQIYSENKFAGQFSFTATNTGQGAFPPTGKTVEVWGVVIAHFENGKLTEEWVGYNNQSFMEQLGFKMIPPSANM